MSPARFEVRPLGRGGPSRSEAQQHPGERELRFEDLRLWSGTHSRSANDGLRLDSILSRPRDYAHLAEVRRRGGHLERRLHLRRDARGQAAVPWKRPCQPILHHHGALGTPPDDVINTIASENVSSHAGFTCTSISLIVQDFEIRQVSAQAGAPALEDQVQECRSFRYVIANGGSMRFPPS